MEADEVDTVVTGVLTDQTFTKTWEIRNFHLIVNSVELVSAQKFEMQTVLKSGAVCTWLIGLRKIKSGNPSIVIYCQLCETTGDLGPNVEAAFETLVYNTRGGIYGRKKTTQKYTVNNEAAIAGGHHLLETRHVDTGILLDSSTPNNAVVIHIQLTVLQLDNLQPPMTDIDRLQLKSQKILHDNMQSLLNNKDSSDLKIVTSDRKELHAHKIILKLQNPVFDAILSAGGSESRTGIVNVKDVCGKTMGIILHFLYTGELLPSWKDPDTVAEFTYAAGKYQLDNIMQMLDKALGDSSSEAYSSSYISLLSLANRLNLQNAERRLLRKISESAAKSEMTDKFFAMIDHQVNGISFVEQYFS